MAQEAGITLNVKTGKAVDGVLKLANSLADVAAEAVGAGAFLKKTKSHFAKLSKPIKGATKGVKKFVQWIGKKLVGDSKNAGKATKGLGEKLLFLNQGLELGQKALGAFAGALSAGMDASRDLRGEFDPLIRNFDKLKTKGKATSAAIGDTFIAAYTGILTAIDETSGGTRDWIKQNRTLITTKIVEWLGDAAKMLIKVATPAMQVFVGLWGGLKLAANAATKGVLKSIEGITGMIAWGARKMGKADLAASLEGWRDAARATAADVSKDMAKTTKETADRLEMLSAAGAKIYDQISKGIPKAMTAAQKAINNASATPLLTQEERLIAAGEKLLELWPRSEAAFKKMVAGMPFDEASGQIDAVRGEVDKFNKMLSIGGKAAVDDVAGPLQGLLDKFGLDYKLNISGNLDEVIENMTRATDILTGALDKTQVDISRADAEIKKVNDTVAGVVDYQTDLQHELVATGQAASESLGSALVMLAKGAEETGEAFKDLGKTAVMAVYDAVTKAVLAYATQAAAGTAAHLAPAGPIAAVAGAGAMLAFVRGLLSQMMTGAALGGFVGGGNKLDRKDNVGPFMLSAGEYIMPTDEVQAMRRFVGQMGGTSGGTAGASSTQTSATTNEIKIDFKSDQLPGRTETKRWVKTTILPALRELQSVGF